MISRDEYRAFIHLSKASIAIVTHAWAVFTSAYEPDVDAMLRSSVGHRLRLGRRDGTYREEDVFEARRRLLADGDVFSQREILLIDLITSRVAMITDVGRKHEFLDYNQPEVRFLLRIRDALSHGNTFDQRFKLKASEPEVFGSLIIDKSLQGKRCLYNFLMPGDIFDLLDVIADGV